MTFDRLAQLMRDCVIQDELHTKGRIVGIEVHEDYANTVIVKIRRCYARRDTLSNEYVTVAVQLDAPKRGVSQ